LVVSRLRYLTANHGSADEVPSEFRDAYAAYSQYRARLDERTRHLENFLGYLVFTPEHLERSVTPEPMRKGAFIGHPDEVRGELGRERQAAELAEAHPPETRETLAELYDGFLALNNDVKGLAARWQHAASEDDRFELHGRLEDVNELAEKTLTHTGEVVPRFGRYAHRLQVALDKIDDDPRYFVSPLVDSYHNVW